MFIYFLFHNYNSIPESVQRGTRQSACFVEEYSPFWYLIIFIYLLQNILWWVVNKDTMCASEASFANSITLMPFVYIDSKFERDIKLPYLHVKLLYKIGQTS